MPNFFRYLYALLSGSCLAALVLRGRSRLLFVLMLLVAVTVTALLGFIGCTKIFNSMIMKNGEVRTTCRDGDGRVVRALKKKTCGNIRISVSVRVRSRQD